MNGAAPEISGLGLAAAYLLLAAPLGAMLWLKAPLWKATLTGVTRMTFQLLFVGFYLEGVFRVNHPALTLLWLAAMILVADGAILRGCRLRWRRVGGAVGTALLLGTLGPLLFLLAVVLGNPPRLDARLAIPLGGMILGNCMRADIVGVRTFFGELRAHERLYLLDLADGASREEALNPFMRKAFETAIAPTLANMATIGLVSLPGMMTGVILGGAAPLTAILYQIVIMLAIYAGTAIAIPCAMHLAARRAFTPAGVLDPAVFRPLSPERKPVRRAPSSTRGDESRK